MALKGHKLSCTIIVQHLTELNKYKCTIDQELSDAASEVTADTVLTQQVAALFCVK